MKMISRLWVTLSFAMIGALLIAAARAAETEPAAKIVKLSGSGSSVVIVNGVPMAAQEQMAVPLNAVIKTTGQDLYLEVAPGVVATVKAGSEVAINTLSATDSLLELRQGRLVTQIDAKRPNKKSYGVKVGNGIAAARGTSYTVTNDRGGFSITTTADKVEYTTSAGTVTIQAGQYSFTPAGSSVPGPAVPLASAASDPTVASIISDAVTTAATVVQNNLGSISAEAATSILAQVVAVAVNAMPGQATVFTATAVAAATAPGSATSSSGESAAGAITAAAVSASPDQAAQIAAAAAAAAPAQAGVIAAAAQQVAPAGAKDAIAEQVAASTGQSTTTVQSSADAAAGTAAQSVNTAKDATSNIVTPAQNTGPTPSPTGSQGSNSKTTDSDQTPVMSVDPTLNVSPAI